ncbi:hypothetical protein [Faecalibacillus faecis]|uniref:phage baseplate plug family protein n=1 Tax=Faecalibacillus faecis TaxID=1982628 RepID=UPI003865B393
MDRITGITSEYRQSFQFLTQNGEKVDFSLYYYITQQSWFFDFTYKDYTCKCQRVVLTPNALRHLKNIIPFGIAFYSNDKVEPIFVDDFESGRVQILVLNTDEVKEVELNIYGIQ